MHSEHIKYEQIDRDGKYDFFIEGIASLYNVVDQQKDVVLPGAFKDSLQVWEKRKKLPFMLFEHNQLKPVGIWLDISESEKGLYAKGQILQDLPYGRDSISLITQGSLYGLSIGYEASQIENRNGVRYIKQAFLHEISLVQEPANKHALMESLTQSRIKHEKQERIACH